jgi:hypothetical protein
MLIISGLLKARNRRFNAQHNSLTKLRKRDTYKYKGKHRKPLTILCNDS